MLPKKLPNESVIIRENIPDGKRINPPTPAERRVLWFLLTGGLASVGYFTYWFFTDTRPGYWPLYTLLLITVGFKLLRLLHEWYHYAAMSAPEPPATKRTWRVDMLTTYVAGEPYDMLVGTLRAMQAVTYPHTTYLCDEANDPYLKQVCQELGVVHVYRGPDKVDAKAGNINYALRHHANGEICVILDPDHRPRPDFLDRTLPYFEEEKVGFVQCIQAYGNQADSLIAKAAAEHTYHFYGPMMMSMNTYGTVQAIGANCTFRRAALDEIGGHAAGLSEDMHTAMRLHSFGWKSVYVPENLSRGLVPDTLSGFYQQQLKWSRGTFDLLFYKFPALVKGFTWRQTLHYLTIPLYFLTGLIAAIDMALPIWALLAARVPIHTHMLPLLEAVGMIFFFLVLSRLYVQKWTLDRREKGLHFWGGVLLLNTWWIYLLGLIYAILRIKVPYIPTPKGSSLKDEWRISIPNILMVALGMVAIWVGLSKDWSLYSWFMAGLVLTNMFMLSVGILIAQRKSTQSIYQELLTGRGSKLRLWWADFRYDVLFTLIRSKKVVVALTFLAWVSFGLYQTDLFRYELRKSDIRQIEKGQEIPVPGLLWGSAASALTAPAAGHIAVADLPWGMLPSAMSIPPATMIQAGKIPWLNWRLDQAGQQDSLFYAKLLAGHFDPYLDRLAENLQDKGLGLFLSPVPPQRGLMAYVAAWRYVYAHLSRQEVRGVEWVWLTHEGLLKAEVWPDYQKGIHLGMSASVERPEFPTLPSRFSDWEAAPVFAVDLSPQGLSQLSPPADTGRLKGILLADTASPEGMVSRWAVRQGLAMAPQLLRPQDRQPAKDLPPSASQASRIVPQPDGTFRWMVDGSPFYIKGVAYTSRQSWRDDETPLVREVLAEDFAQIREMGGNTIRRFIPSVFDLNILREADAQNLHVLYGFWVDPAWDFQGDSLEMATEKRLILKQLAELKDHAPILAWTLGQGTWQRIQEFCTPTYTPHQRRAYLAFLEDLIQAIKALDPNHPVAIILEEGAGLDLALSEVKTWLPSVDLVGVQGTLSTRPGRVDSLYALYGPDKPFFYAGFGPSGLDETGQFRLDRHQRWEEPSDLEKAQAYYQQWTQHIAPARGRNLGGVAFAWRDRMGPTRTWWGITDTRFRKKASYYALQEAWLGHSNWPMRLTDLRLEVIPRSSQDFEVRAAVPRPVIKGYTFSWSLVNDDFLHDTGELTPFLHTDSRFVMVRTPHPATSAHRYRVVLHVDDNHGHVITASVPLQLSPSRYTVPQ
ncbi:MAG: glycosyltransferase [Bacteroidetes bacterium]|nr:MAG: glycosyltransferase [Bacteroidota bacterium]